MNIKEEIKKLLEDDKTYEWCEACDRKGEVYVHDPSADGHGGLNGGMWVWLQCSNCGGRGFKEHECEYDD